MPPIGATVTYTVDEYRLRPAARYCAQQAGICGLDGLTCCCQR